MSPPPPVLVGMAPGRSSTPGLPLFPRPASSAGGRLAALAGLDWREYLQFFQRVNLLQEWPGAAGTGDAWPRERARVAAQALEHLLAGRVVVFVGRNVAEAFGLWSEFWAGGVEVGLDYLHVCIPHPSGRNRMYNDEESCRRTREVLREALDEEKRAWIAQIAERRKISRRKRR